MGRKRLTTDTAMLTTADVCAVAGIPVPTLSAWCRKGIVGPTIPAEGRGTARAWNVEDAAAVVQLTRLRRYASLQAIRRALEALHLEGKDKPLARCSLRVVNGRVHRVRDGRMVEVAPAGGQAVWIAATVWDALRDAARRRLVPLPVKAKPAKRRTKTA